MFFLTFDFNHAIEIDMPNSYYPLSRIVNLMGHHLIVNCTFFNLMGYHLIADCTFPPITFTPLKIEIKVLLTYLPPPTAYCCCMQLRPPDTWSLT